MKVLLRARSDRGGGFADLRSAQNALGFVAQTLRLQSGRQRARRTRNIGVIGGVESPSNRQPAPMHGGGMRVVPDFRIRVAENREHIGLHSWLALQNGQTPVGLRQYLAEHVGVTTDGG